MHENRQQPRGNLVERAIPRQADEDALRRGLQPDRLVVQVEELPAIALALSLFAMACSQRFDRTKRNRWVAHDANMRPARSSSIPW